MNGGTHLCMLYGYYKWYHDLL